MVQILFIYWMTLVALFTTPAAAPSPAERAGIGRDYCNIYGAVYLELNPMYRNTATATVFLKEDEAFADLVVYRENNKLFADGTGIWYITPSKAFADHVLYVTDQRHLANFTVYFTDVRSSAICREQ
jgi:hypothetical protein